MIDDILRNEIAAAVCGAEAGVLKSCVCVLGIEVVTRERWRAWLHPYNSPRTLLLLVSLRGNSAGRTFDLQPCLNITRWHTLHGSPVNMLSHVEHLVDEFDRFAGRSGRRRCREIRVAALPLSFCDPWDRLWVYYDPARAGQPPNRLGTLLVWQHGDALFLAAGWNSTLSPALTATSAHDPLRGTGELHPSLAASRKNGHYGM